MGEISKKADAEVVPITEQATVASPLVTMMERFAANPDVNPDVMTMLFERYDAEQDRNARQEYNQALALMQPELPVIEENGEITGKADNNGVAPVRSTYAYWEDVAEGILPVLGKHGFGLTHRTEFKDDGRMVIVGVLSHVGGHSETSSFITQADTSGSKNNIQGWGSALSYGKRYTAQPLTGYTTKAVPAWQRKKRGSEDDDGQSTGAKITDAQSQNLRKALDDNEIDIQKFCETYELEAYTDIAPKNYEAALVAIGKAAKNKKANAK